MQFALIQLNCSKIRCTQRFETQMFGFGINGGLFTVKSINAPSVYLQVCVNIENSEKFMFKNVVCGAETGHLANCVLVGGLKMFVFYRS